MTHRPTLMKNQFKIALLVGVVAVLCGSMFSLTSSTANAQSSYSLKVAKNAQDDFTVTNGASFTGSSFDTTYIITGTQADFIKGRDTLISSVTEDFSKSPTIGYVKMENTFNAANQSGTNMTGLANPFVSQDQINQKIKSALTYALDKIEHPIGITPDVGDSREIKCKFGNVLNDFWCDIPTFAIK